MAEPVVCSQCGARNPAELEWCGQCFASLAGDAGSEVAAATSDDALKTQVAVPPLTAARADSVETGGEIGNVPDGAPGTWVCTLCDTPNPLDFEQCSACGTSIFTAFGAAVEEQIEVDPQQALLRSVMFPGLGHAHVKQGLLGAAIGGVTIMALGFGIALLATGEGRFGLPLVLLVVGVWVAAALDAYRIADGQATDAILLRPRVVTALVGIVMVVVIMAALMAQGKT